MCTFDEQKLNKIKSKGHMHIICRCVNYNMINNIILLFTEQIILSTIFSSFIKDSDNLNRKIILSS